MLYLRASVRHLVRHAKRFQHSSAQSNLNAVTPDDIAHFAKFLPQNAILSTLSPISIAPSEIEQYNTDWMGKYHGSSTTVLRPHTTEQVSKIIKWCHERRIGVVPQGGNTGLVGGSVPIKNELILSLSNMSKVRSFDPVSGVLRVFPKVDPGSNAHDLYSYDLGALVADAGCILEGISEYIAPHNHIMPLDLGAKGRYIWTPVYIMFAKFYASQLSDWRKHLDKCRRTPSSTVWLLAWKRARTRSSTTGRHYPG